MRKVKILALLLSALMVVAVFAGCADTTAIESDVAGLDERVTNLENLINGIDADIDDTKEQLDGIKEDIANADANEAIEDLKQDIADQKESYEAQIKEQAEANKALADALAALQTTLDAVKKDLDDTKEVVDKDQTGDSTLIAAKQEKSKLIAAAKATYEANKAEYTADDYAAIVTALSTADIDINAATTVADVNTLYAALQTELAKYAQVNDYLYSQVLAYQGNITAASAEGVKAAKKYLDETAKAVYGAAYATNEKLTKYVTGQDEDGDDITINLVTWINHLYALQTGTKTQLLQDPKTGDVVRTLAYVTDLAEDLVEDIKDLGTVVYKKNTTLDAVIDAYYNEADGWLVYAKYLGEDNLALVSNAATLDAAKARLQVLTDAEIAYGKLGKYNVNTKAYDSVFAAWNALTADEKLLYTNKDVYDTINDKIDAWANTYDLEDENVVAIITQATNNANANYDNGTKTDELGKRTSYLANSEYVALMDEAAKAFAKEIAPRVLALNEITALSAEVFAEYAAIEEAVEDWMTRRADDKETTDVNELVEVNTVNYLAIASEALDYTVATLETVALYDFELNAADTFFTVTYAAAKTAAENIEKELDKIQVATVSSILPFITLYGDMANTNSVWTYIDEANIADYDAATNNTIAGFLKTYVVEAVADDKDTADIDESMPGYDLSVLLPLEEYNSKKNTVLATLNARAAEAKAIEDAWKVYVAAVDSTFAATEKANKWANGTITATTTLAHKADLDAIVKLYKDWVVAGGSVSMEQFALVKDSTTEYEFTKIIDVTSIASMNTHNAAMSDLNTWAGNMANIFKYLAELNAASAFKFDQLGSFYSVLKAEKVTYNMIDATTGLETTKTAYKYTMYNTNGTVGTKGYKWESKTGYLTSSSNTYKQGSFYSSQFCDGNKSVVTKKISDMILAAAQNYDAFIEANGYQNHKAVEDAKANNGYSAILLTAVKGAANALLTSTNDYVTAAKGAISAAKDVNGIATALVSYYAALGTDATATVAFNGVTYITVDAVAGEAPAVVVVNTIK